MKRSLIALTAALVVAGVAAAAFTVPAEAFGQRGGWGYHQMMGPGDGFGPGRGYGMGRRGDCPWGAKTLDRELTADDVRDIIEGRLAWRGADRLKVGKVEAQDEDTIVAEIVTVDDSLVWRLSFDRKTGQMTRLP